jgi:hypothetical protein
VGHQQEFMNVEMNEGSSDIVCDVNTVTSRFECLRPRSVAMNDAYDAYVDNELSTVI